MRHPRLSQWSMLVLLAASLSLVHPARAADDDQKAVARAAAQFYTALNAMFTGDLTAMTAVWSHADDVTFMGPGGGFQVGWEQVSAIWKAQAAMKLGGTVKPDGMHITVGDDLAIASNFEKGENTNVNATSMAKPSRSRSG